MYITKALLASLTTISAFVGVFAAPTAEQDPSEVDDLNSTGLELLQQWEETAPNSTANERRSIFGNKCSIFTASVRREWSTLTKNERRAYVKAVQCLMKKPSRLSPAEVPGAKNRYDDFVAVHIQQTMTNHGTANFLVWHRYFTWLYEQALRKECGYTGSFPYWNWGLTSDPSKSSVFDGSDASMGSNGAYVPHGNIDIGGGLMQIPSGTGGGCVTRGPFADMSVNLGPVVPALDYVPPQAGSGLDYNPRCLRRDLNAKVASTWANAWETTRLILQSHNVHWFQTNMQGDFANGFLGVHSGGHYAIGGDPGGDLFVSPGDPAFFLHHGMIDRIYFIWQSLGIPKRWSEVAGTITINNTPPSRNGTLDDLIDMSVLSDEPPKKHGELMNTLDGPFCYIYI